VYEVGDVIVLNEPVNKKITALAGALIDQHQARMVVEPYADEPGFWFGGGNLIAADDGNLYISGRYRNSGDARTGVGKGSRGLELAIFRSRDSGRSFEKIVSFSKEDLNTDDKQVISIVYLPLGDGLQSVYPYLLPAGQGDRDVAAVPDNRCPTPCHAFFVLG
jgi:hypothetical protein